MVIVMKAGVRPESPEVQRVISHAQSFTGVKAEVYQIQGATRTVTEIYVFDPNDAIPATAFDRFAAVEGVVRIASKLRVIGRHDSALDSLGFEYSGLCFSQDSFHVFPGLCAVDTPKHVEAMFKALAACSVVTTRAGAYKPRTSPYEFQGHGAQCLPYLFELAGKYGIRVIAMEVTHESHVDEIFAALEASGNATGVMLQIGTRNAQNFELLKAVGQQTELPVLFKRGMGITLDESLNACEYLASRGNRKIIFGLRGMKTHLGDPHRNLVDFSHVPVVKRLTRLPVCIDPSHSVGQRGVAPDGVLDILHATAQGVIAGANMVLVDFHPDPDKALCDGPQALRLKELQHFLEDAALARRAYEARLALAKAHAFAAREPLDVGSRGTTEVFRDIRSKACV